MDPKLLLTAIVLILVVWYFFIRKKKVSMPTDLNGVFSMADSLTSDQLYSIITVITKTPLPTIQALSDTQKSKLAIIYVCVSGYITVNDPTYASKTPAFDSKQTSVNDYLLNLPTSS